MAPLSLMKKRQNARFTLMVSVPENELRCRKYLERQEIKTQNMPKNSTCLDKYKGVKNFTYKLIGGSRIVSEL